MTLFIILSAALLILVLWWLTRCYRVSNSVAAKASYPNEQQLSLEVLKEELKYWQTERTAGRISTADFEAAQLELQQRVLQDADSPPGDSANAQAASTSFASSHKKTIWCLVIGIMALSAFVYACLGSPASLDPQTRQARLLQEQSAMIQTMVQRLEAKLKANPQDYDGWAQLGRSYHVLGQTSQSAQAYEKAMPTLKNNPPALLDYAQVLAILDNNDLNKRALTIAEQAQRQDPQQPLAWVIIGAAAYQRTDYAQAVAAWEKLLPMLDPGSPEGQQVIATIAQAKEKAAAASQAGAK